MRVCIGLSFLVALTCLPPTGAAASDPAPVSETDDGTPPWAEVLGPGEPALCAIQQRKFELAHEFALLAGSLPANPYYKGLTGSLGYTLHFDETVAWEIVQATYSYNLETNLKKQLLRTFFQKETSPPALPQVAWYVSSRAVLKPLYGKQAFLGGSVVHVEGYMLAGPALVALTGAATSLTFGVDWCIGARIWFSQVASFRVELGQLLYRSDGAVAQALHVSGGLAFNLGSDG